MEMCSGETNPFTVMDEARGKLVRRRITKNKSTKRQTIFYIETS